MSLYVIGDLHLSLSCKKPMDIYTGWDNYMDRIKENWLKCVKPEDTVVISGDISWAMDLNESVDDFMFIEKLPGNKIILKGNHDYWWSTARKINNFFDEHNIKSIKLLHNNSYKVNNASICGSRGWINEHNETSNIKVNAREALRLEASIKEGINLGGEIIVFLHYPPIFANEENYDILDVLYKYDIKKCYYGHIHGSAKKFAINGVRSGIDFKLISCDNINFCPHLVF